jgi:hypothetical protein
MSRRVQLTECRKFRKILGTGDIRRRVARSRCQLPRDFGQSFVASVTDWRNDSANSQSYVISIFMRAVFSSLVAVSLFIHAMIGCCWHHAHESACCNDSPVEQAAEVGCCHHNHSEHGDQQHGQPSQAPCKGHSHCQGLCTYLPPQKSHVDTFSPHTPLDFAAIAPATCDVHVVAVVRAERTHESPAGPPLRLHLYYQILVI